MVDDDEKHQPALSDVELRRVRQLLRDDEFAHRFWKTIRVWASWISGAIIAVAAMQETVGKFLKKLVS